ncbi:MAG: hypothetical protein HY791_01085 [Deltaproteobacteria bacterium]|nr:hypothetical protein [Deltaproteobacteria bacterium]
MSLTDRSSLEALAVRFLESCGGLVDGTQVMLPPDLQRVFAQPELTRLSFDGRSAGLLVSPDCEFAEHALSVLGDRGRVSFAELPVPFKAPRDAASLVPSAITLANGVVKLVSAAPATTRCAVVLVELIAQSDERLPGAVRLLINTATESVWSFSSVGGVEQLRSGDGETGQDLGIDQAKSAVAEAVDWAALEKVVSRACTARIPSALASFVHSTARRRSRDEARLLDYHKKLRDEATEKLAKAMAKQGKDAELRREELRLEAIQREYRARLEDLRTKYALSIEQVWTQTTFVSTPSLRLELEIKRRKESRRISLDVPALSKRPEPPIDEFAGASDRLRSACDESLHLVSRGGLDPCVGCGRVYCRACAAACPKCGRPAEE